VLKPAEVGERLSKGHFFTATRPKTLSLDELRRSISPSPTSGDCLSHVDMCSLYKGKFKLSHPAKGRFPPARFPHPPRYIAETVKTAVARESTSILSRVSSHDKASWPSMILSRRSAHSLGKPPRASEGLRCGPCRTLQEEKTTREYPLVEAEMQAPDYYSRHSLPREDVLHF